MIRGFKYKKDDGTQVQISCNRKKQWYEREFIPGDGYGGWRRVSPPTVIDGHLRQGGEYINVEVLHSHHAE